jgi:mannitol 2-dehydrogenase
VIGSIIGFLHGPDDPEALLSRMSDPATRIVSLTVTEGGYNVDPVTGRFVTEDPQVQEDLRALRAGEPPATVFGYVIEALRRRWDAGGDSFTVQSCDNIPGNGDVARRLFSAFAESLDPALAQRIRRQVRFPNAMVDRITPVTTDADREELREGPGIEDAWPVVAEPFFQWVIEDDFGQGRPPYEDAGAQMVPDVTPYEHMKIRLLNASHQGLAYFGTLAGHTFAHEAMADPAFGRYLRRYMDEEATPSLEPVPGVDLEAYKDTLLERFANPEIRDTLARLGAESSDRIPKWLVPVILEDLDAGVPVPVSAAICASWARYAEGTGENGEAIGVVDRFAEDIRDVASRQAEDPLAFVRQDRFFGDLADREEFTGGYLAALGALHRYGAAEVVRRLADHEAL